MCTNRSLHLVRRFSSAVQFLVAIPPFVVEVMQILIGLLEVDCSLEENTEHPALTVFRSGRAPDTYRTDHFATGKKALLSLTRVPHAADLRKDMNMLYREISATLHLGKLRANLCVEAHDGPGCLEIL
eukprot:8460579-Pyramimonas_sp.AAC.1